MRLLQLHEYLSLLAPGVDGGPLDPETARAGLAAAVAVWPRTGLSPWSAGERAVGYAWHRRDGALTGVHVTADDPESFVVVVLERPAMTPAGYLVLDIGAEYRAPVFVCPDLSFEGPPDEGLVRKGLAALTDGVDSFAALDAGKGTYLQTCREPGGLLRLEHQLVTTRNHYRSRDALDAATATQAFLSYAFGRKEWATEIQWELMALD